MKVSGFSDLPEYIKEMVNNTGDEVKQGQEKKFLAPFAKPLQSYKKAKLKEFEMEIARTITPDNVETFANRIEKLIVMTKGLTDATRIDNWLMSFPNFSATTTFQNNLRIALEFVQDYAEKSHGTKQQKYDFGVLKNEIQRLSRRSNKSKQVREKVRRKATANILPRRQEIKKIRMECEKFLKEHLVAEPMPVSADGYYLVSCRLICLFIIRNNSRTKPSAHFVTSISNRLRGAKLVKCGILNLYRTTSET